MLCECSMCGLGPKTTVVTIGLWTLLQSLLYTGLSASAILVHRCFIDLTENAFQYLLYFIYFRDKECGEDRFDILFDNIPPEANLPVFPAVTSLAHRTFIISFIYLILSFLWLVSSVLLLTGTYISCLGRKGFYLFCLPWVTFAIGNILIDIAATVFFTIDLTNSLSIESLLLWLQAENIENSLPYLDGFNNIALVIPSIIMLTFSCRGLILFIFNIFCLFLVISAGLKLTEELPSKRSSFDGFEYATQQTQSSSAETRYTDQMQNSNGNEAIYRMYLKNSNYYENDGFVSDSELTNRSSKRHSESAESKRSSEYTGVRRTVEKLKGGDDLSQLSHDKRSTDSRSQNSIELQEKPIKKIPPIVPVKPTKKFNDSNHIQGNRISNHGTNEELRSQLPWSYFQARDNLAPRPQSSQANDLINPPIPVPDYTLHFPKKERQTFDRE